MTVLGDAWNYLTTWSNWTGDRGMLHLLEQQLLLTFTAMLIAMVVGLPIALWLGHLGKGGFLAINITNIGRAIPTFAMLAILVTADFPGVREFGPYGRAGLATLLALALFALPPLITNSYVAVREVPADVKQAADGMGMTGAQKFFRVELPLALPLITSGIRLALVQVWATATIAALVAGPGLGRVITDGFFRTNYGKGIAGAIVVGIVALLLELLAAAIQRRVAPVRVTDRHRTVTQQCRWRPLRWPQAPADLGAAGPPSQQVTHHRDSTIRTRVATRSRDTEGTSCRSDDLLPRCSPSAPSSSPRRVPMTTSARARTTPTRAPRRPRPTSESSETSAGGPVTLAGQSFPEAALVAAMYQQLLEKAGYEVTTKLVDSRDGYMADFPGGVDIVPEYVGGIVNFLNSQKNGDERHAVRGR